MHWSVFINGYNKPHIIVRAVYVATFCSLKQCKKEKVIKYYVE